MSRDQGFSLIETLVAGAVLAIATASTAVVFRAAAQLHASRMTETLAGDAAANVAADLSAYARYSREAALAVGNRGSYGFELTHGGIRLRCIIRANAGGANVWSVACAGTNGVEYRATAIAAALPMPGSLLSPDAAAENGS